ncbi:MAG: phage tail assembly protein [Chloroflexota bacterium]|nr:phage tail assembly protein [Chloroflexota bacterium]
MAGLQTEFDFVLPKGYIDSEGNLHRKGTMRMATAMDEITPLRDPRVKNNQAYLSIILLSRVVTKLGKLNDADITPNLMERLFSADLAYLQGLYNRINSINFDETVCPTCGRKLSNPDEEEATEATAVGG